MPAFAWSLMTQRVRLSLAAPGTASARSARWALAAARWSRWFWAGESSSLCRWSAPVRRPLSHFFPALILQVVTKCVRNLWWGHFCPSMSKHSDIIICYYRLDMWFLNIRMKSLLTLMSWWFLNCSQLLLDCCANRSCVSRDYCKREWCFLTCLG